MAALAFVHVSFAATTKEYAKTKEHQQGAENFHLHSGYTKYNCKVSSNVAA